LANEQETKRRLQAQSQTTIIPTKVSPVSKPETRDLTTTLMENNLKQMSHMTSALPAPAFPVQPQSFPAPFRPAGAPGMVTSPTGFTAFQSTPALGWPNSATATQWSTGNMNSNSMSMNAGNLNSNQMSVNAQTGWSTSMTSPPATPLNNMFRSPSSQFSNSSTPQSQTKSLSNADINDLLG